MLLLTTVMASSSALGAKQAATQACEVELIVLGTGQDVGAPQIGYHDDAAWSDDSLALWPTSIAVVDHTTKPPVQETLRALP